MLSSCPGHCGGGWGNWPYGRLLPVDDLSGLGSVKGGNVPRCGVLILRGALSGKGGSEVVTVGGGKLGEGDCVGEEYAWVPPSTKPFCNEGFNVSNIDGICSSWQHVITCCSTAMSWIKIAARRSTTENGSFVRGGRARFWGYGRTRCDRLGRKSYLNWSPPMKHFSLSKGARIGRMRCLPQQDRSGDEQIPGPKAERCAAADGGPVA